MTSTEPRELLQQIVENTTPMKSTMISISSTNPEFSVNFPTAIPAKEIALAHLRVYYSWPNIRSKPFGGLPANNSFVFANKIKDDGTPDWQVVAIPPGSYQLEQINEELQRRIKSLTKKEAKIAITTHEPTLSSVIEINSPDYMVDIYQSSIRSVLGWPDSTSGNASVSEPTILKNNNGSFGTGRHISPGIVNITSTIALNLICDAVDGSYDVNLNRSNQAQQGFILYSSSIQSPPGWLIVSEPINQVYLRVQNPLLSRMNFRLTNQDGNTVDLRGETLYINLYIRS